MMQCSSEAECGELRVEKGVVHDFYLIICTFAALQVLVAAELPRPEATLDSPT
jgi:hypothetical protein